MSKIVIVSTVIETYEGNDALVYVDDDQNAHPIEQQFKFYLSDTEHSLRRAIPGADITVKGILCA